MCDYRQDFGFLPSGFPGGAEIKASACNVGDVGSIPGSGVHKESDATSLSFTFTFTMC